ncbi:hypothetical protein [Streptomyces sp. CC224B]|uniref:hypothetical protein n=1 Tax=Streptomyces sp. CC224B TaxID=3044571 RepID=UPI0024A81E31|nr:hypothetical protein [Streptomyces sp. CC224B]
MGLKAERATRGGGRRRWTRAAATVFAAGALASLVTGCGGEKPVRLSGGTFTKELPRAEARGQQLTRQTLDLLKGARSMRINAVEMKGSLAGGTGTRREATFRVDREHNCAGTIAEGYLRADMIMVEGRTVYMRVQDSSLDALRSMAEARGPGVAADMDRRIGLLRGKYVKFPVGDQGSGERTMPSDTCDLDGMLGRLDGVAGTTTIRAEDPTWRYGEHVIPLVEEQNGTETKVYVAAEGKPYLVAMEMERPRGARTTLRISDYDEPVVAKAPPAAQTIDADEFDGMTGGADLFEV